MAEPGEVDPDLVGAAGLEPRRDQRRAGERLDGATWVTARLPSIGRSIVCAATLADRDRAVLAIDIVAHERIAEPLVGVARAREHEQPAGRQIEAVHQVDLAEAARQLIEQVAAVALRRRCGDQAGRFVDDDHVVVDVDDLGLRRRLGRARSRRRA